MAERKQQQNKPGKAAKAVATKKAAKRKPASKTGRPTKYSPKMCDTVIEMGKGGASKAEMAAKLDVSRETFNRWEHEMPTFRDAVKRAVEFSQAWWEERGRVATFCGGKQFSALSYIFQMKNRFPDDWREKQVVEHQGEIGVDLWSRVRGSAPQNP